MATSRDVGPVLAWVAVVLLMVALVVGLVLTVSPQLLGSTPNAAVREAEERLSSSPGVVDVTTELDTDTLTRREARRELLDGRDRPSGEVTIEIVVAATVDADAMGSILVDARTALLDARLDDYEVSIVLLQQTTGTRMFDGWTPLLPMRNISREQLRDAAAFALTLPDGSWLDLEPASHEQGWLGRVGPPYLRMLLDGSLRDGSTIAIPVYAASGTELLTTAERLTAEAAASLVGPSALELRTPDGMLVRTVTAPSPLPTALAQLHALVAAVPGAESSRVELDAAIDWITDDGFEVVAVPTITLDLDLGAAACASGVDADAIATEVEAIYDAQDVDHDVTVRCDGT